MRLLPLLVALAVIPATMPATARETVPPEGDALHDYVLSRAALAGSDIQGAAHYLDSARNLDPRAPALARRAFDLALAAGDKPRSLELAASLSADQQDSTTALIKLTDAVLRRDWTAAAAARTGLSTAGFNEVVGPIVDAWLLFGRGQPDAALAALDPAKFSGFARSYVAEQRAHMLGAAGRWRPAADAYAELLAGTGGGINFLRVGQADALAMGGDRAAALKALDSAGQDDGPIRAARARLASGKRIGALAPDPRRAIGWLAARLASDLSRDKPVPLSLVFARVGTFLAPDIPATWLICGDVLARSGQGAAALLAYAQTPPGDALADSVRARRAEVLQGLDRDAEAGALLKAAASAKGADASDWLRLGDWYRSKDINTDAAAAYGRAIALTPAADAWLPYFLRGSVRERGGDWAAAEPDLREALKRAPDEPVILNYLGYSLLDRGARIDEARTLIERAARLKPDDGGIIDSLGWVQFRQGQFADAMATLERAVALEPTDPTVGTHLGDAYWRVGRRIEARFRWRMALALDPTPTEAKVLQAKLDYGLDAALAMAAAK